MKFKTTQKAIKENYSNIICVGYCELSYLLSDINSIAYTVRREGWGCDIYVLGCDVALTTGYAPFGNIKASHAICHKYNEQAQAMIFNAYMSFNGSATLKQKMATLREQFVQEVLNNAQQA